MSFIDSIKYIQQLNVIDEFGGRGRSNKISKFYIILKVTDESGNPIEISFGDVSDAVKNGQFVISDYIGLKDYSTGNIGDSGSDFILKDAVYRFEDNIITFEPSLLARSTSVSVKFKNDRNDIAVIASTCYQSDFPSTFYLDHDN
ncbi:hypothetical protein [Yokenella regensburgei]|uniref:hypothetical protein n=1 Tax=Yokenella regensburgei TaxID=158877 RepID=UPI001432FFD3|nr:hypothetical protein [Yokenella regensburgei]QIU88414.1 hypothetical protein HEC60_03055 [Yokenella regensburgei]